MEHKIYLKDFPCYQSAAEKTKRQMGAGLCFDLERLCEQRMREEAGAFIQYRGSTLSLATIFRDRIYYNNLCQFMQEKGKGTKSFAEIDLGKWERKLRAWMLENHMKLTEEGRNLSGSVSYRKSKRLLYFENLLKFSKNADGREETEKDVWELDRLSLNIRRNPTKNFKTLNFTKIYQPDIRDEVKKAVYVHLRSEAIASVVMELTAVRRLSAFLKEKYPRVESCMELNRKIFEGYLIHLKTEAAPNAHLHTDLGRLRAILETVGKLYRYPHLEGMILTRDIPPTPQAEFKVYSDAELKRMNACLAKQQIQIARLMVIHQMLGTRISDTLTLRTDCLSRKQGEAVIRIKQMKTRPYEKPISEELAMLIQAAIEDTRELHGDTSYIFVNEKDPTGPMQYGTIQYVIYKMIHDEDLRDDNGSLFGFNSHMYRHYYGVKLTEMHLDDWTLARLLGHSSIRNVRYYRRMSNWLLADETRPTRKMLSQMICDNLKGWGEEYEQIRQDDSLE